MKPYTYILLVSVLALGELNTASSQLPSAKIAFQSSRDGNMEIYVMNADATNQIRLTKNTVDDEYPEWSPDGSKIAFHSNRDGNYQIYVMSADGASQTRIANSGSNDYTPAWSPDGQRIVFASDRTGNKEIFVINSDGTNPTKLTSNSAEDGAPHWSPDGTKIEFYSTRENGIPDIYVMNSDGSNQTQLTFGYWTDAARWSPDGSKLLFAYDANIAVMNADGSNMTMILTKSCCPGPRIGSWSPDGSKIIFAWTSAAGNYDSYELYTMNSDGSSVSPLTINTAFDCFPVWSPISWEVTNDFANFVGNLGGYHPGEDWNLLGTRDPSADLGKPVFAIADGIVVHKSTVGKTRPLGFLVAIEHSGTFTIPGKTATENGQTYSYPTEAVNSIYSIYVHIDKVKLGNGDLVQKGQIVGMIADLSSAGLLPHLHFEIRLPGGFPSNDWSLVSTANEDYSNCVPIVDPKKGKTTGYTGYYRNVQEMVNAGLRDPSEFVYANFGAIDAGLRLLTSQFSPSEKQGPPLTFSLGQNFPNPFNPLTTIRYGLPERSHVSLAVYNTLGQQVAVLQNGEKEAGYHEVKFDASSLPSGVYLYRLQAGGYVETRKLCLVR